MVDGDARGLQIGEHVLQRQLQPGQELGARLLGELGVERIGQLGHRGRRDHLRGGPLGVGLLCSAQERQLAALVLAGQPQLPAQVAQREIGEVEAALAGAGEVGRERGVAGEARERPAAAAQRVQRGFDVVCGLGHGRIGEPLPQRRLVIGRERGDLDVARLRHARRGARRPRLDRRLAGGEADAGEVGGGRGAGDAVEGQPDAAPVARVLVEPRPQRPLRDRAALHLDAALGLGLRALQRGEQALAQDPELQLVEEAVHRIAVPGAHDEIGGLDLQRNVAHQLGELPVEQHARQVGAQRVARLALHLVHPVGEPASDPNSRTHFAAVFSPTPGIEGRLSEGSPRSAA